MDDKFFTIKSDKEFRCCSSYYIDGDFTLICKKETSYNDLGNDFYNAIQYPKGDQKFTIEF